MRGKIWKETLARYDINIFNSTQGRITDAIKNTHLANESCVLIQTSCP